MYRGIHSIWLLVYLSVHTHAHSRMHNGWSERSYCNCTASIQLSNQSPIRNDDKKKNRFTQWMGWMEWMTDTQMRVNERKVERFDGEKEEEEQKKQKTVSPARDWTETDWLLTTYVLMAHINYHCVTWWWRFFFCRFVDRRHHRITRTHHSHTHNTLFRSQKSLFNRISVLIRYGEFVSRLTFARKFVLFVGHRKVAGRFRRRGWIRIFINIYDSSLANIWRLKETFFSIQFAFDLLMARPMVMVKVLIEYESNSDVQSSR